MAAALWAVPGPASRASDPPAAVSRRVGVRSLDAVARWTSPPVDVDALLREDARAARRPGIVRRVGLPMKVDLSPATAGTWEPLEDGGRLWRLRLTTPGALWIVVGLETFRVPPGARLWVYDPSETTLLGPYTADDVREHGQLWFPPIDGGTAVLELEWPSALSELDPAIRVGTVSHGYKSWGGAGEGVPFVEPGSTGPGAAGDCNVDVNCPAGAEWQDEKRGVVQLLSGGYAFCSGSLINNTAGDCRPYLLTAAHCGAGPGTTVRFQYERPGCESGSPPVDRTLTGASVVASYAPSDFTLLELDHPIPTEFDAYFNGWRRSGSTEGGSTGIHHPSGDVKKISRDDDPPSSGQYWGVSHWRVGDWEMGTTEGGSSGSPLFDESGRIVGQLHGGTASCANPGWDEYGKLAFSWWGGGTPATRLSDWLDPLTTAVETLDGLDRAACDVPAPDLTIAELVVEEAAGNGDGHPDPGETIALRVRLANGGTLGAGGVTGTLSASSALVAVTGAVADWPPIDPGTDALSLLPSFTLTIDPQWSCGMPLALQLDLWAAEPEDAWSLPFELPTGSQNVAELFADDVEGAVAGWTVETPVGSNPWVTTDTRSASPVRSWHALDPAEAGETSLVLPTLVDLPAGTELTFSHEMDSEAGFDGGVLELSVDGVTWSDAGPLIVQGGYNAAIGLTQSSSLSGRQAWTGDLGGWHEVIVDLAPLAGSDVALRWRFASDASVGDNGWFVDDVVAAARTPVCAPFPPGEASAPDGGAEPFRIGRDEDGFHLQWGSPTDGGPVADYALYAVPLTAPWSEPTCEVLLGIGTTASVGTLPDGHGFLVVARNATGEGSYGSTDAGAPRPRASATCP